MSERRRLAIIFEQPIRGDFVLRLVSPLASTDSMRCRVDWGVVAEYYERASTPVTGSDAGSGAAAIRRASTRSRRTGSSRVVPARCHCCGERADFLLGDRAIVSPCRCCPGVVIGRQGQRAKERIRSQRYSARVPLLCDDHAPFNIDVLGRWAEIVSARPCGHGWCLSRHRDRAQSVWRQYDRYCFGRDP